MFKEPFEAFANSSILARACKKGLLSFHFASLLEEVNFDHHIIDDTPYGGGPGELMKIDIIAPLIEKMLLRNPSPREKKRVLLMDPAGKPFTQEDAKRLSHYDELLFICGRYEGIDARIYHYIDEAISIGDYVLSSGDLAAMVVCDATARMVEGVLGNFSSTVEESHSFGRLEASHYTRPSSYQGFSVPDALKNGNHKEIEKMRRFESIIKTKKLRPDLLEKFPLSEEEKALILTPLEKNDYPWLKHE